MPRPCQRRRATAAENRKSKSTKPQGPPPIRHKARQKAIHNARKAERGGARGGRGRGRGGQQHNGGGRFAHGRKNNGDQEEQDFIPLSGSGNNFEALYRARPDYDMDSIDERHTQPSDSHSDYDSLTDSDILDDDEDLEDTQDISINIEESLPTHGRRKTPRATVMFTVPAAVAIYKEMYLSQFPLSVLTLRTRYGLFLEDTTPDSGAYISLASSAASRPPTVSSATSEEPAIVGKVIRTDLEAHNPARDYIFNWGVNSGKRFIEVDDKYLRTIGGQLYRYTDMHPGLLEAFEYHRPGQARLSPPKPGPQGRQRGSKAKKAAQQAPQQPSAHEPSQPETSKSQKGKQKGKRRRP
ncbi:hypothetical protein COCMIDRAFT_83238 [Bipolaris oryzae ATCC 44560]|uniref:Uncharacterized protein n=1 Tax=Bipolaris oryzae ATCC 44560 TaxID=930090 RepID=W6ZIU1_COCMI|nr:uncharacterized protein COCMIDRAFT_83238 [Bipolaris oryzae ATCC 44560]EUC49918.1 hypothetical protein COCMIDRAFT_83238 [Bipolaris oryzae ATCC 44560]